MKNKLLILGLLILAINLNMLAQSSKAGFGGDVYAEDLNVAKNFSWYYNWNGQPLPEVSDSASEYLEYVPMIWDTTFNKQALRTYLSSHSEVKYILGFNEPNFLEQSNMTPTQAASSWHMVEEIADEFNLTIIGPAVVPGWSGIVVTDNGKEYTDPVQWYDEFFEACEGCRVDHIAIHAYFNKPAVLKGYINSFAKFNKPIWITEFNHSFYDNDVNATTFESQQDFMRKAIPVLENDPLVFRYAWFMSRCSIQDNTSLYGEKGELSDLGQLYADVTKESSKNRTTDADSNASLNRPEGYTLACGENEVIHISDSDTVNLAYGAYGMYVYLYNQTGKDVGCSSAAFGDDPAYGVVKSCYIQPVKGTSGANSASGKK